MASTNSTTIELIKKYNFTIQKKYGQNFLIDDNILNGIVSSAEITKEDTVLEIGPGLGALTAVLCRSAKQVVAVEIDKMLIPILQESLQDYDNVRIINEDVLKVNLEEILKETNSKKIKVVANLPYYITTPIILELLEKHDCFQSITVMVQKEVAERMQEGPGSKSYGALSLAVQYYSRPNYVMTVSKHCFLPKPEVDSAVIRLDIYEKEQRPVQPKNPEQMFRIIRAAFNQRRKTLVNGLVNAPNVSASKEQILKALEVMEKSGTIRGETLTLQEFARLSDLLSSSGEDNR